MAELALKLPPRGSSQRRPLTNTQTMLVGQTAINLAANVFSAVFGLINVVVFTRLFAPAEFGVYVLGIGFAGIASTFMTSWLRLPVMREQARGDGTDVRGILVPGLAIAGAMSPIAYLAALMAGLDSEAALAATGLALAFGFFDISQELLRARLQAFTLMRATIIRAVMVSVLGIGAAMLSRAGVLLLVASALAYLLGAWSFARDAWGGTVIGFDGKRLIGLAKAGLPLTISLTLLTLSSVIDRFLIAHLINASAAGQFSAGADLVRQTLIIPAVSASAAFVPLAVQINARQGGEAAREHLDQTLEFLLAIILPACIGLAIVSSHIANVVLGPDFRSMAAAVMPIVAIAVVFQIMTYQYLHISFLLSERNSFYLLNTVSSLGVNVIVSLVLIAHLGALGAAWGRLAAEIFGFLTALLLTRWAFPMPIPYLRLTRVLIATFVMAIAIRSIDLVWQPNDRAGLTLLLPVGVAVYGAMCWILDIAKSRQRLSHGLMLLRNALAR
jgi:O-antigen/teichoic acid export membrane protein